MVDRTNNFHSEDIRKTLKTSKHERASIDPRFNESTPRNLRGWPHARRTGLDLWASLENHNVHFDRLHVWNWTAGCFHLSGSIRVGRLGSLLCILRDLATSKRL
ncbi:Ribulose bisphosphate carboxylase large chain [Trichinella spiralis]|uniref:Ribulose bisphosphate carboxylase large chain n=1 Tax=Trichinella spiralis TaxID=6334 RepID=A0ABR3KZ19_TRISP